MIRCGRCGTTWTVGTPVCHRCGTALLSAAPRRRSGRVVVAILACGVAFAVVAGVTATVVLRTAPAASVSDASSAALAPVPMPPPHLCSRTMITTVGIGSRIVDPGYDFGQTGPIIPLSASDASQLQTSTPDGLARGFKASAFCLFQGGQGGEMRVTLTDFDSPDHASHSLDAVRLSWERDQRTVFPTPGLPAGITGLGSEASASGAGLDTVAFVKGPTLAVVRIGGMADDEATLETVAREQFQSLP